MATRSGRLLRPGVLVAALLVATVVAAVEVPYLSGRVNDQAGLLGDSFETGLDGRLRQLEEETGAQVVVLTIPSLEGDPIEDFSIRVVETWNLGRAGADDGVLILIVRDDRRMRIEVGYGLEGALTDAQSGRIIDGLMAPRFRSGDFEGGIEAAVDAVSSAIRGEPVVLPDVPARGRGVNPGSLIFFLIFGLPFIGAALSSRGAAGWILYLFLTPFFFAFPAAILGHGRRGGRRRLAGRFSPAATHLAQDRGKSRRGFEAWYLLGSLHRRRRRRFRWWRIWRWFLRRWRQLRRRRRDAVIRTATGDQQHSEHDNQLIRGLFHAENYKRFQGSSSQPGQQRSPEITATAAK